MTSLRVATANCASGRDAATGAPTLTRWARDAAALDLDLLAVQEVDHLLPRSGARDQTATIAKALAQDGAEWSSRFAAAVHGTPGVAESFRASTATVRDEPSYGVALLSRHPVRDWRELRMAPSRLSLPVPAPPGTGSRVHWAPDEQRVALAGVVATPDGEVTVVCTHLSFSPVRAVGQLREIARWCASWPRPLLLVGDLNLPASVVSRLSGLTPLATAPTFPATRPRAQLDHVLLDDPRGRLTAGEGRAVTLGGSDHLALVSDLRWA